MEGSDIRKQWHAPFCAAVRLELREDQEDLEFIEEYNLSSKPLQIDLLVIRKTNGHPIKSKIGEIFCGLNLLEYKSPGQEMGIDVYFKVLGYACLLKAFEKKENSIKAEDITISFVREGYPRTLLQYLEKEQGLSIVNRYPGIYHITGKTLFAVQVLVTSQLDEKDHIWLKSLTKNMDIRSAERMILEIRKLHTKGELQDANAVLNLVKEANSQLFLNVKEGDALFEALEEIVKPSTDRKIKEAVEKATKEVTKVVTEEVTKEVSDQTRVQDTKNIMKRFHVSLEEACNIIGWTSDQFSAAVDKPKVTTEITSE